MNDSTLKYRPSERTGKSKERKGSTSWSWTTVKSSMLQKTPSSVSCCLKKGWKSPEQDWRRFKLTPNFPMEKSALYLLQARTAKEVKNYDWHDINQTSSISLDQSKKEYWIAWRKCAKFLYPIQLSHWVIGRFCPQAKTQSKRNF